MSENNKAPEGHSKACEYAKHDKCECKCNGAFHMIHTKKEITEYHIEKMNEKKDPNQTNLDKYISKPEESEIEKLRAELHKITGSAAVNSHKNQDKALELIRQITELERK